MFFAVLEIARGRPSESPVRALEERLIGLGMQRNDRMSNVSGTKEDDLAFRGVMGAGRGRRSTTANAFRSITGI